MAFLVTTGLSSKWSGLTSCCADIEMDKRTMAANIRPIPGRDGFANFIFFFSVELGASCERSMVRQRRLLKITKVIQARI